MIICTCRAISDHDYDTEEELHDRIMQDDHVCGKCKEVYIDEPTQTKGENKE